MAQQRRMGEADTARSVERLPRMREVMLDIVREGKRRAVVHAIAQVEVTAARARIAALKARGLEPPSMTAFIVYCVARAIAAHPHVHALRRGRELHLFDAVDVSTVVERRLPDGRAVPTSLVVRGANTLTLRQIHQLIRAAQQVELQGSSVGSDKQSRRASLLARLPRAVRQLVWWKVRRDPEFRKRNLGTVLVTAVGMFAEVGPTAWAIPLGSWPLTITVGTIGHVFVPDAQGAPRLAEMLNITLSVDHEVVDGGPVTRFAVDMRDMILACEGFDAFEAGAGAG